MPGINDSLNCNLTTRRSLTATTFTDGSYYIYDFTIVAESHVMMFGFRNPEAKSNWWLAADLYQQLLTLPSYTSHFQASVEAYRARCRLNTLALIKFTNYGFLPFLVKISFPRWHKEMEVEAWYYSGEQYDESLKTLSQIQSQVTEIASQFNSEL